MILGDLKIAGTFKGDIGVQEGCVEFRVDRGSITLVILGLIVLLFLNAFMWVTPTISRAINPFYLVTKSHEPSSTGTVEGDRGSTGIYRI